MTLGSQEPECVTYKHLTSLHKAGLLPSTSFTTVSIRCGFGDPTCLLSYLLDSLWQGAERKLCARYFSVGSHLPSHPSCGFTVASIISEGAEIQRE